MIYKTQEELNAALAKWQVLLNLQEWQITAELVGYQDISDESWGAQNSIRYTHRCSRIRVLKDGHWKDEVIAHNHDHDLLHELLHLLTFELANAEGDEQHSCADEVLINRLVKITLTNSEEQK